jgi:hypothetical protein
MRGEAHGRMPQGKLDGQTDGWLARAKSTHPALGAAAAAGFAGNPRSGEQGARRGKEG